MTRQILVIDDDRLFAESLVFLLHRAGFTASAPAPGPSTLESIRAAHADSSVGLLISDLFMPEPDGFEVLRFAREHLPGVPVMGMSGWNKGLLCAMRLLGAAQVHAKPVDVEQLLTDVRWLLGPQTAEIGER
jgi:DNA-binding NtrC family response regulator